MSPIPELATERLTLGALHDEDAAELERLAGAREIADTTIGIPHPYTRTDAERFIARQREAGARGDEVIFAIRRVARRLCLPARDRSRTPAGRAGLLDRGTVLGARVCHGGLTGRR